MDSASFEGMLRSDGYGEIETKRLPAGTHNSEHDHPFDVRALVLEGQISLTFDGEARTFRQGDVFALAAGCRHTEDVGADGVRYLVGRRRSAVA